MAKFVVHCADLSGKLSSRVLEAKSERAALAQIEAGGLTPIRVESGENETVGRSAKTAKASTTRTGRIRTIKGGWARRRATMDFTHQLAAVAESGIPIIAGLKAVAEQTRNADLRAAVYRIASRVEGGKSLADALDGEPDFFPDIFIKTVAAGEAAGKVPEVLLALARYQEQEADTRGQIRSALLYPTLVAGSLVLATAFMLVFVVPQFAAMFEKFEGRLPLPTRILMAVSSAITQHYLIVLPILVATGFVIRRLLTYSSVRAWLDPRLLRLPVFGNLLLGVYMVRLVELLDLLMQAALPITQSLRVTADSMTNRALKQDVRTMLRAVEGGRSLTEAFNEARWLTPLVKRMLAIGEYAGRTDQIFAYLRKYYATQTQRSVKLLSTLVEPVLVGGLAAVVLFFALAIFLPMWKLLKLVGSA